MERRRLMERHGDSMGTKKNKLKATLRFPAWGYVESVITETALRKRGYSCSIQSH